MKEIILYDMELHEVARVQIPSTPMPPRYSPMTEEPEIICWQGRYFHVDHETGDYNEGTFYEVPA